MDVKKIQSKYFVISLSLFLLGAIAGYSVSFYKYRNIVAKFHSIREGESSYTFIAPLIGFTTPSAPSLGQFKTLDGKIRDVFEKSSPKEIFRYAVYFRDLQDGFWVGINEEEKYDPASMLKVVAAIATYKEIEKNPSFKNRYLVYSEDFARLDASFPYGEKTKLITGQSYPVTKLIEAMIIDSDNGAKDLLLYSIDSRILDEVYTDLGIPKPGEDSSAYAISAREYSRFFRILYNATYLSREYSEALLSFLSQATYTKGLVAGVPKNTQVAHKFGQRIVTQTDNLTKNTELHDCGIVYTSPHPYFLCVMTEGLNEETLARFIARVSQVTFEEFKKTYTN